MKDAETVTFGGSGLDRAAAIRRDVPALAAYAQDPASRCIVVWRGKILVAGDDARGVVRLPMDHPMLAQTSGPQIFLGFEGGALFARDLSGWEPDADVPQVSGFTDQSEQHHPTCTQGERFAEPRAMLMQLTPRDAEVAATARALFAWHESHGFCARCGAASEPVMAGWQRTCPACGTHHFPRTDPVVIMLITRGNSCLLGRSPGWPEAMYSCLAGFIEPGETVEAAVRRETFEETGIRVDAVRYLASQPWPFPASLMIGCHGVAEPGEITIDPDEIEAARWISREDLARAFAGEDPTLFPARKGSIAHFLLRGWLADRLD
ncbi:NAD(+) diphosphatase [Citreicella sp. C3M06]|uniref:NAD(+) diphosphatase n=1 Tax=Citreicella sp. C3M06 TaxID=2841564 RepID=UPI001C08A054|nr:NAD(+) diphosphatase [Citreicella sp. C3M06]MBU2961671.1 NAD(+) diphosphatase [Citreicella sp. C3M06]